jgi:hypothetical protein
MEISHTNVDKFLGNPSYNDNTKWRLEGQDTYQAVAGRSQLLEYISIPETSNANSKINLTIINIDTCFKKKRIEQGTEKLMEKLYGNFNFVMEPYLSCLTGQVIDKYGVIFFSIVYL